MKAGDSFDCPHCGKNTFLKKESVMDGWTRKGEALFCASCSAKIKELVPEKKDSLDNSVKAASALASILGTEKEEKPKIESTGDEKVFCRDCMHLVSHPFLTRCSKHGKDVNPMDDCPDFERKAGKKDK